MNPKGKNPDHGDGSVELIGMKAITEHCKLSADTILAWTRDRGFPA